MGSITLVIPEYYQGFLIGNAVNEVEREDKKK